MPGGVILIADPVKGQVPAQGRLVVSSSTDVTAVIVGQQSRYYDPATALVIPGSDLTALGASTVESGANNLCTNPEAVTDTTGWTNNSLTTFERVTSLPTTAGLPAGVTTGFHCVGNGDNDHARDDIAVVSGRTYQFSVYAYLDSNTATGLKLEVRSAAGVTKVASAADFSTLDAWSRLDVSVLADATETWTWRIRQTGAGDTDFYFTAVEVEQADELSSYGDVVRNTDLTPTWTGIASSGALTHKGSFRIWLQTERPTTNNGEVQIRLEWAKGDYRNPDQLDPVVFAADAHEGVLLLADLGVAHPDGASWELRVLAKSSVVGDEIDVTRVYFQPTGPERNAIVLQNRIPFETPSSYSARDEFDHSVSGGSDPLTGKTLPVGGTWAGTGDAVDFVVEDTGRTAQRSTNGDTLPGTVPIDGRVALAGTTDYTNIAVQVSQSYTATDLPAYWGLFARYVDDNNWLAASVRPGTASTDSVIELVKRVAGNVETVRQLELPGVIQAAGETKALRLQPDDHGRVFVWLRAAGSGSGTPVLIAHDDDLATGGALEEGQIGFFDHKGASSSVASTRTFDNFFAFVPTVDAACFANQTLELRHDGAEREPAAGGDLQTISRRRGKYLEIPAAGMESRVSRLLVLAVTGPEVADRVFMDEDPPDVEATLYAVPRFLNVPEP